MHSLSQNPSPAPQMVPGDHWEWSFSVRSKPWAELGVVHEHRVTNSTARDTAGGRLTPQSQRGARSQRAALCMKVMCSNLPRSLSRMGPPGPQGAWRGPHRRAACARSTEREENLRPMLSSKGNWPGWAQPYKLCTELAMCLFNEINPFPRWVGLFLSTFPFQSLKCLWVGCVCVYMCVSAIHL